MRYLPPGRIGDFARAKNPEELAQNWHNKTLKEIERYRGLPRFLDPLSADAGAVRDIIAWTGFPRIFDAWLSVDENPDPVERMRRLDRAHRSAELLERYAYVQIRGEQGFVAVQADPDKGWMLYPEINGKVSLQHAFSFSERPQDEYLEWHVVRDQVTGRITRLDFTAEAPEYWETLAETDSDLVQRLYSELLGVEVPKGDLFFAGNVFCQEVEFISENQVRNLGHVRLFPDDPDYEKGQYNRRNKWNTELGAVHLTQPNNTLFAEINLAALATQRFPVRPNLDTEVDRFSLTACGGYGALNRNSDPTIGYAVNSLALSGFRAMVSNPIGLYIGEIDVSGLRDPAGQTVRREDVLTIQRGSLRDEDGLARVLRFSVHPPAGANYGLESCTFDGFPLTTGGPIARKTTVVIHGIAVPAEGEPPLATCEATACAHTTKKPVFYLRNASSKPCPASTDEVWSQEPVTLAPELAPFPAPARAIHSPGAPPSHFSSRNLA